MSAYVSSDELLSRLCEDAPHLVLLHKLFYVILRNKETTIKLHKMAKSDTTNDN